MSSSTADDRRSGGRRSVARVPATADRDVVEVVVDIARSLRERETAIVQAMSELLSHEIDQLDNDPILIELLESSVRGNVSTIIHVLANDTSVEHLQPTTAAVDYALRLAQRDVPSHSLVRAYHMGQNDMMRLCFDEVRARALPPPLDLAVMKHISDVLYSYIDWITLFVFEAYEDERKRWLGARGNVHSSTIHGLLSSSDSTSGPFEAETGYRLDQTHLALIIWHTDADEAAAMNALDRIARSTATLLRSNGLPVVTAIDRRTLWAWIPLGKRALAIDTQNIREALTLDGARLAVGLPAGGIDGFRRSHEQAQAAYSVANVTGTSTPEVVGFGDRGVAVVSLLARDLDSTRAWVWEVLGPLAEHTDTAAQLRLTLSTYFTTGESHLHTAHKLNLHRNTVKYRINKFVTPHLADHDRLDLALALQACEFLGTRVLKPAAL